MLTWGVIREMNVSRRQWNVTPSSLARTAKRENTSDTLWGIVGNSVGPVRSRPAKAARAAALRGSGSALADLGIVTRRVPP